MKRKTPNKRKSCKNMIYMANPIYGGWVTFTAHLSLKFKYPLYKVGKRTENFTREYGYGAKYKNISNTDLSKLNNVMITAIDKHYYQYLDSLPKNTTIVIHDPTEVKTSEKYPNPLLKYLPKWNVITIRSAVKEYLFKTYKIKSTLMKHPFYLYSIPKQVSSGSYAISISRIDFDKNTDIILRANKLIKDSKRKVLLYGAENRMYVHHKLGNLNFKKYWKGRFNKTLPPSINQNTNILGGVKYMVDLSVIKNDGGGTQYTFLEAIHQGCCLILHKKWVNQPKSIFKHGFNCLAVETPEELATILNKNMNVNTLVSNSKKILNSHIRALW
jgi:glycosyltransferase involved in cell wall biosynthesis